MSEFDDPGGAEGMEEALATTDRELLELAWADLRAAGVPVQLWWAAWGEDEQRLVDRLPDGNGIGTLLVSAVDLDRALAALHAAERTRVDRHVGDLPRDLRRLAILVLSVVLILTTVLGLWRSRTPGMVATTCAFFLLIGWDVLAARERDRED